MKAKHEIDTGFNCQCGGDILMRGEKRLRDGPFQPVGWDKSQGALNPHWRQCRCEECGAIFDPDHDRYREAREQIREKFSI